jgi:hypothetical protein
VIVTDAKLEIVFASHNMTKMNGYVEEEVIGRAKMFQGNSSMLTSSKIRKDSTAKFEQNSCEL